MLSRILFALALLQVCATVAASDITITGVEWRRDPRGSEFSVKFTVSWNNAWNNSRNHDAAWIFVKYQSPSYRVAGYRHAKLMAARHEMLINHVAGSPAPAFTVTEDRNGVYISPGTAYRGNISWTMAMECSPPMVMPAMQTGLREAPRRPASGSKAAAIMSTTCSTTVLIRMGP